MPRHRKPVPISTLSDPVMPVESARTRLADLRSRLPSMAGLAYIQAARLERELVETVSQGQGSREDEAERLAALSPEDRRAAARSLLGDWPDDLLIVALEVATARGLCG